MIDLIYWDSWTKFYIAFTTTETAKYRLIKTAINNNNKESEPVTGRHHTMTMHQTTMERTKIPRNLRESDINT